MDSGLYLCYSVDIKDLDEARKKTMEPPFPVLIKLPERVNNPHCITIRAEGKEKQYKLTDIVYAQAKGRYLFFNIRGYTGSILCENFTLKDFEKAFPDLFVRIGNGCVVNKQEVLHYAEARPHGLELAHFPDANLKISRHYFRSFHSSMVSYYKSL
jgi:DNA-binding LytR/AlgR family response regulator